MALSEHEQRLLDEMERGFYQSEADVMQTATGARRRVNYRSLVLGIVVVIVGIGALVGGVASQQLWLGLLGFAIMIGGVTLMLAKGPADVAVSEERSAGQKQRAHSRESFSERAERRWDERMEGER